MDISLFKCHIDEFWLQGKDVVDLECFTTAAKGNIWTQESKQREGEQEANQLLIRARVVQSV
jgi:hypothetical protein